MEWFYRLSGVNELDSIESFFEFFAVPYDAQALQARGLPVLTEFHHRLRAAVPLRNLLDDDDRADWRLAQRLLAESYRDQAGGEAV